MWVMPLELCHYSILYYWEDEEESSLNAAKMLYFTIVCIFLVRPSFMFLRIQRTVHV